MATSKSAFGRKTHKPIWIEVLAISLLGALALKSLYNFQAAVDLGIADEALYLTRGVAFMQTKLDPQWAPLYSAWYFLLNKLFGLHDNLQLHDLSYLVLTILGPLLLYIYLRRIQVKPVTAFIASALYLISFSNLGITPFQGKFAVACVLVCLLATTTLPRRFHYAVLLIALLLLSFIRPEYAFAFVLATVLAVGVLVYRVLRLGPSYLKSRSLWFQIAAILALTVILVQFMGNPLQGARSDSAFKQHFAVNYVSWGLADSNPWSAADAVAQEAFGEIHSIPSMALNNPVIFARHLLSNASLYPQNLAITTVFTPNLPKYLSPATVASGVSLAIRGFLLAIVLVCVALNRRYARRQRHFVGLVAGSATGVAAQVSDPDSSSPVGGNKPPEAAPARMPQQRPALRDRLTRRFRCAVPAFCGQANVYAAQVVVALLILISIPSLAASLLIYPRFHYLQIQALLLLILLAIFVSNTLSLTSWFSKSTAKTGLALAAAGAALLLLTPNLASGWSWPSASSPRHTDVRSTVELLRSLDIQKPVRFVSYTRTLYSFNTYLGSHYVSATTPSVDSLRKFLQDQRVNMIIWPDRLANETPYRNYDDLGQLLDDPASFGFAEFTVPGATGKSNGRVLIAQVLMSALPQASAPESAASTEVASDPTPSPAAAQEGDQNQLADELVQAGQIEELITLFREQVNANPSDRGLQMTLAATLAKAGRDTEALAEYEAISTRWPDFPWAHTRRGEILDRLGDIPTSIEAFETAVQLAPDDPNARFVLAYAYRHAGMRDQAIAAFEAGLAIDPDRPAARKVLDELKSAAGNQQPDRVTTHSQIVAPSPGRD